MSARHRSRSRASSHMAVVISGDPQVIQVVKDGINPSRPWAPLWPPGVWGATKEHLVWPPVRVHTQDMAKPSELTVAYYGDNAD